MNMSQKGVVFLDSSIIIRYFVGDNNAKKILETTFTNLVLIIILLRCT